MRPLFFVACLAASIASCSDPGTAPGGGSGSASASPAAAPAAKKVPHVLTQTERDNLMDLGDAFAKAVSAGDNDAMGKLWNVDVLWDRIADGIAIPKSDLAKSGIEFKSGMKAKGASPLGDIAGMPCSFRMIREDDQEGPSLLFRLLPESGGVNYFECQIDDLAADHPKICDAFVFLSGELLSNTVKRLLAPLLAQESKTPLQKLFSEKDPLSEHQDAILKAMASLRSGDPEAALNTLDALPASVRSNKFVLIFRFNAVSQLYDTSQDPPPFEKEYLAAIGELKTHLSGDPRSQLLLIDYHLLNGDYEAFYQSLDKLAEVVGNDGYVEYLRATGLSQEGKHEAALASGKRAVDFEPENEAIHLGIVDVLVGAGKFQETADQLVFLQEEYGYQFDFAGMVEMEAFLNSEPGRAWLDRQQGDQTDPTIPEGGPASEATPQ
ncbi:MAG: hypothetical protein R3F11_30080 [Verrucomicrobiales bacterium]